MCLCYASTLQANLHNWCNTLQARTEQLESEIAQATLQLQQLEDSQRQLEARNGLLQAFTAANQQVRTGATPVQQLGHVEVCMPVDMSSATSLAAYPTG